MLKMRVLTKTKRIAEILILLFSIFFVACNNDEDKNIFQDKNNKKNVPLSIKSIGIYEKKEPLPGETHTTKLQHIKYSSDSTICFLGNSNWNNTKEKIPQNMKTSNPLPDPQKKIFYPAPGYRGCNSGIFYNIGMCGICWSSTSNILGTSYYLNFYNDLLQITEANNRSYGFPVRCVQE